MVRVRTIRSVSLHRRQYTGEGILMEGRRWGSHRAEVTGTVTRKFTQLRITLHEGRAYYCLELSGRLARDYNDCGSAPKAPGVPVYIAVPEPLGFLRWSPTHIQVSLAYVTLSYMPRIRSPSSSMSVPIAPPGPSGFRYHLGRGRLDPASLVPGLDFFHLNQQQLGRPAGYTPPPPSWATRACRNLGTTIGYP